MSLSNTNYTKATELLKKTEYSAALDFFNLAIEADPTDPNILADRAVCYFHLQKFELALIDLNDAVSIEPNYGYRYSSRAYVKERMDDLQGAIADYEKAVKLDPEDAIAYNNLGMIQEKLGHRKLANQFYKRSNILSGLDENKALIQEEPTVTDNVTKPTEPIEPIAPKDPSVSKTMLDILLNPREWKNLFAFIANGFKLKK